METVIVATPNGAKEKKSLTYKLLSFQETRSRERGPRSLRVKIDRERGGRRGKGGLFQEL